MLPPPFFFLILLGLDEVVVGLNANGLQLSIVLVDVLLCMILALSELCGGSWNNSRNMDDVLVDYRLELPSLKFRFLPDFRQS